MRKFEVNPQGEAEEKEMSEVEVERVREADITEKLKKLEDINEELRKLIAEKDRLITELRQLGAEKRIIEENRE